VIPLRRHFGDRSLRGEIECRRRTPRKPAKQLHPVQAQIKNGGQDKRRGTLVPCRARLHRGYRGTAAAGHSAARALSSALREAWRSAKGIPMRGHAQRLPP
jgi:hypothetical protein